MAWENPKTNWGQSGQTVPIADDFNRIEGNILHLQDTKETPAGAQAKAEAAAGAVQAELNMHKADNAAHVPQAHASSDTTYGVGTTANYGHCKTINNLTQSSHVNGNALSAYQGKVLKDLIGNTIIAGTYTGNDASSRTINVGFRPKAVLVLCAGKYIVSSINTQGGLAIDGHPILGYKRDNAQQQIIIIASTGFTIKAGDYYDEVNKSGLVYHYVAFR